MKNKGLRRALAGIALIITAVCLAGLLYSAFFGGDRSLTLALLFLLIVVPSVIFIFIRFTDNLTRGSGGEDEH